MAAESWYLHIQGETFGPVSTQVVTIMLRQNRLLFSDYVWAKGLTKWSRLGDLHQFASLMPPYPNAPIPGDDAPEAPAPKPARQAAPVAQAAPVVQPEPGIPPNQHRLRRYPRIPLPGTVEVAGYGVFELIDLSEGGIFLKAGTTNIPHGTDVKFSLAANAFPKPLDMTGLVIRAGDSDDGTKGFAIQFTRVNPAHKRVIQEYVQSQNP
jgi:hypothetical protein